VRACELIAWSLRLIREAEHLAYVVELEPELSSASNEAQALDAGGPYRR
jgi:hypothetical protein